MKRLSERNPMTVGAVGVALTAGVMVGALNYDDLPFINSARHYSAYFAEAGGLTSGAAVQVAGYQVGQVSDVTLDGAQVVVDFTVDRAVRLGDRTEAAIKTRTLLGGRMLEVSPRGDGQLSSPVPLERTTAPYELPTVLGDLSKAIGGLDTAQLNDSLTTLAQTFQNTPPALKAAVDGVAAFSETLNKRDEQLRSLLAKANNVTAVLSQRSDQIVQLVGDTNALLVQLRTQSSALDSLLGHVSALAQQLSELVADNKTQLRPALDKLNGVLTIVDNHKADLQKSIKLLSSFTLSLGEAVASGPFFKAYNINLVPGQLMQPFIDAAFSDLGLDPNVLLPSQLTDPQVGQPATPPMPLPYPRTGQGGDPRLTLPDAITGNPGDPRYPYRQPPPQPAPGGPPPGPPAGYDPHALSPTGPVPTSTELAPPPDMPGTGTATP